MITLPLRPLMEANVRIERSKYGSRHREPVPYGLHSGRRRLLLSLLVVAACAPVGVRVAEETKPSSLVIVRNDRIEDLSIYLEHNGVKTRKLGVARGSSTDTLLVGNQELIGFASIAIVAVDPTSGDVRKSNIATARSGAHYRLYLGAGSGPPFLWVRLPRP